MIISHIAGVSSQTARDTAEDLIRAMMKEVEEEARLLSRQVAGLSLFNMQMFSNLRNDFQHSRAVLCLLH